MSQSESGSDFDDHGLGNIAAADTNALLSLMVEKSSTVSAEGAFRSIRSKTRNYDARVPELQ